MQLPFRFSDKYAAAVGATGMVAKNKPIVTLTARGI